MARVRQPMPRERKKQVIVSTATAPRTARRLYESDYYSWAVGQARALRDHQNGNLDWENLADEVEDLANRNADALESQSERLIGHLLKIAFAPRRIRNENLRLWQLSVRDARRKIRTILKRNPGLRSRTGELFIEAWPGGRDHALGALELPDQVIPEACMWTFDQAMDDEFEPSTSEHPKG
jgi:hypothetical protein